MNKNTRYITRIFALDRFYYGTGYISWENKLDQYLEEENIHYGLKIISEQEEAFIKIEYSNIIWEYKILFGTYKKKYKTLTKNDERWQFIEESLKTDLKSIGLSHLKEEILNSLKKKEYFAYQEVTAMQFRRYCV